MHAITHSISHRAPPATRTRVRWQPYAIMQASIVSSSTRSPSTYLNTPNSVTSSPPSSIQIREIDKLRHAFVTANPPQTKENPSRDSQRNKLALGLVDQAVKSLCEIWRPQDIPSVFLTPAMTTSTKPPSPQEPTHVGLSNRNTQLPSPVTPSVTPSPPSSLTSSKPKLPPANFNQQTNLPAVDVGTRNLVPIKGFVHEVLRRSRTSGYVLQTALCYIEAIRPQIPEILRKERTGEDLNEPDPGCRIVADADFVLPDSNTQGVHGASNAPNASIHDPSMAAAIKTVRVIDGGNEECLATTSSGCISDTPLAITAESQETSQSAPRLPSPLLCPRRTFLASLILASKFTQDKCYSNRAWAKLSGLPPREIGRCERALGDALGWRLWVGKVPVPSSASTSAPVHRPVVRCRSDGSLMAHGSSRPTTFASEVPNAISSTSPSLPAPAGRTLQRASTLPAQHFEAPTSRLDHMACGSGAEVDCCPLSQARYSNNACNLGRMPSINNTTNVTNSPQTPGLTYSPSSTESSSGDRTIQMTTFMEETMSFGSGSQSSGPDSGVWPWHDTCEPTMPALVTKPFSMKVCGPDDSTSIPCSGTYTGFLHTGYPESQGIPGFFQAA